MLEVQESVKSSEIGRVRHLTVDHPPRNQISIGILQRLAELVSECEGDDNVRAILLDSANQTPPFAADGEALPADASPPTSTCDTLGAGFVDTGERERPGAAESRTQGGRTERTERPRGSDGSDGRPAERREAGGGGRSSDHPGETGRRVMTGHPDWEDSLRGKPNTAT
jgi:hypothetical protein